MKKIKIIIVILIIVLLIVGTISLLNFHKEKKKEVNVISEIGEDVTIEDYGEDVGNYTDPEDVLSIIMDGYLGPNDTVEYEKTEGDCWYYIDSKAHHYMYCQSNPVIVYIP